MIHRSIGLHGWMNKTMDKLQERTMDGWIDKMVDKTIYCFIHHFIHPSLDDQCIGFFFFLCVLFYLSFYIIIYHDKNDK